MIKKFLLTLCLLIPNITFAITLDELNAMRRAGVLVKETISQREFSEIRDNTTPTEFLNFFGISFEGKPVVRLPDFLFAMPNIREINMKDTDLRIEYLVGISGLEKLERLDLSYNLRLFESGYKCDFLNDWLACSREKTGFLDGYDRVNYPTLGDVLDGLTKLRILDLTGVGGLRTSTIGFYPDGQYNPWKTINLRELHIRSLVEDNGNREWDYSSVQNLYQLNIGHMDIQKLTISNVGLDFDWVLGELADTLVYLDISDNRYFGLHSDLDFNIDGETIDTHASLPHLEYLNVSGTALGTEGGGIIAAEYRGIFEMPSLRTLIIDEGQIGIFPFLCAKFPTEPRCGK